jgi:maleate cis-trans isomerase
MNYKELTVEELNKLQKKASENAIKLNEAMGLSYLVVRNNNLIQIDPDG